MNRLLFLLLVVAAPAAATTLPGLFTVAVPAGDALNIRATPGAGAEILVAGTAVFAGGDPEGGARRILDACR